MELLESSTNGEKDTGRGHQFVILFAAVAFMYLYFFPYFAQLHSPADDSRITMVKAIAPPGRA